MNWIFKTLLTVSLLGTVGVYAEECETSSMYYFKLGAETLPIDKPIPIPRIGFGARFYEGNHAWDVSLNFSSLVIANELSLKGLYLHYPQPECPNRWYFGGGLGAGYCLAVNSEFGYLSLEGVLGYEFNHDRKWKTFLQLELSQPVLLMGGRFVNRHGFPLPGIALVGGIGF